MNTFTENDISNAAKRLEGKGAIDVLRWAEARFIGRIGMATGFGLEGCALIHMISTYGLKIDIFTLDTGLFFPETYDLWLKLQATYGVSIQSVATNISLEVQQERFGDELWRNDPGKCCNIRKVKPLEAHLSQYDAWITAIRRSQTEERANAEVVERDKKFDLIKVNPLLLWSDSDVSHYILENNVPYNSLHDEGYPSIGCAPCTSPVSEGEDPRAGRWRNTSKTECGIHTES